MEARGNCFRFFNFAAPYIGIAVADVSIIRVPNVGSFQWGAGRRNKLAQAVTFPIAVQSQRKEVRLDGRADAQNVRKQRFESCEHGLRRAREQLEID